MLRLQRSAEKASLVCSLERVFLRLPFQADTVTRSALAARMRSRSLASCGDLLGYAYAMIVDRISDGNSRGKARYE